MNDLKALIYDTIVNLSELFHLALLYIKNNVNFLNTFQKVITSQRM